MLDGWRGICALLVVLFHFNALGTLYGLPLVRNSFLFVDFFFVLSGFVISYAYCDKIDTVRDMATFIVRRFGRLWPLHVATLAAFVVFELAKEPIAQLSGAQLKTPAFDPNSPALCEAILTNVLFLHSLGIHERLTWNHPSWSISTEFFAYITFALLSLLRFGRSIVWPALISVAAGLVVVVYSKFLMNVTYDLGYFRCICGFFVGHLVFRLWRAGIPALRFSTAAEAGALVGVFAFVGLLGATRWSFASPLVFGVAVWVFAHEAGSVSQLMRSRALVTLGAWSYSIYMVHALVVMLINRGLKVVERIAGVPLLIDGPRESEGGLRELVSFGSPLAMDLLTVGYLAVVVALAAMTYRFIEVPGREFFNRLARRMVDRPAQLAATAVGPSQVAEPQRVGTGFSPR